MDCIKTNKKKISDNTRAKPMTVGTVQTNHSKVDASDIIIWFYSWSRLLQPRSKAGDLGDLGDLVAVPVGDNH